MLRRTTTWLLILLALLSALATPASAGVWRCEGRICGVTFWRCCCDEQEGRCDGKGRDAESHRSSSDRQAVVLCAQADCACEMQLTPDISGAILPVGFNAALDLPLFALVPQPVVLYVVPVLNDTAECRIDSRGPPGLGVVPTSASLRAPPAA